MLVVALLGAIGPLPSWIVAWTVNTGLSAEQWAGAVSEERRSVLLVLGGLIAVISLYYTARRHALNEDSNRTDRYSAAIVNLGSEYAEVRTGGVYALERIMRESNRDRAAISDVLCAFVRARAVQRYDEDQQTFAPLPIDLDAAVRVIARRGSVADGYPPADLAGTDLSGVYIPNAQLANANLQGCTLFRADLTGADLSGAKLSGSILNLTILRAADLSNTDAGVSGELKSARTTGTQMQEAKLAGSRWVRCTFHVAQLTEVSAASADFTYAHFNSSSLTGEFVGADFLGASFNETSVGGDFQGANLREAGGSTSFFRASFEQADLTGARFGGCIFDNCNFNGALTDSATNNELPLV
ncbi:pentapeptide repeat-containing protein [Cryocola sp. 340MFSha3.1]|uniref:pentapeptide repeat-containing protein n=1 Tax=Cryocola sp. 340MFSha3.1 TaxID=1169145 RepID=UPI0018CA5908|nr:pentapeptide repeat-containing protein [Cryocola sp. 340MFSha3.1]